MSRDSGRGTSEGSSTWAMNEPVTIQPVAHCKKRNCSSERENDRNTVAHTDFEWLETRARYGEDVAASKTRDRISSNEAIIKSSSTGSFASDTENRSTAAESITSARRKAKTLLLTVQIAASMRSKHLLSGYKCHHAREVGPME